MTSRESDRSRVAIVSALRTPFLKQGTGFSELTTVELASIVVAELIQRTGIDPDTYTLCVFGQAIPSLDYINLAREVVLRTNLDSSIDAYSVACACATSMRALTCAIHEIQNGNHNAAIVGGADSMDDVPIGVSRPLARALLKARKARTLLDRVKALTSVSLKDWVPPTPGYIVEPTTGMSMGESAEKMAKENGISRAWQDEIAHRSHRNATRAWSEGFHTDLVMPVAAPCRREAFGRDNTMREDSKLEDYAKLKPIFDRHHGTVTAGNSSPLTDGAAALTVMREQTAQELGLTPLGFIRSWAYHAVDPRWQLLMAPVFAVPKALQQAGLTLKDISVVEMHEAFAAQVASNLQALASSSFCRDRLGLATPVGEVDPEIINVNGGSIGLGHPFGATGARIVMQGLKELRLRQKQFGLMTICAGGALGVAAVLEVN